MKKLYEDILIGNQTAFSAENPTLPFEYAVENGFNTFEWFPDKRSSEIGWSECDISPQMRLDIKKRAIENNISLSVHAPWWANPIETESQTYIEESIRFASDIGAKFLNIHLNMEKGAAYYVDAITPYLKQLALHGIKLSIENTVTTSPDDFNNIFSIIRKTIDLNQNEIGMCFDLGHANLCPKTHNDYLKFFDSIDRNIPIIHIHLHENYGDKNSHLTLFTGPSADNPDGICGFVERLVNRNFIGSIILQQWPDPPLLLNRTRDRLYTIINEKLQPILKPILEGHDNSRMKPPSLPFKSNEIFLDTIVNADKTVVSWREKLLWVYNLFLDESFLPDIEKLIYLSIYLRFIHTGKIICNEDGRHFRPQHHANIAQDLYKILDEITNSENMFVIRKIYPFIPSFDDAFTNKEPLTRIRDIAHRNDIPQELKHEIKHTLQNKLHRCADPKDLETSRVILKRITAPDADFSPQFVDEFKIFHEELLEFFNAKPIEKLLEIILSSDEFKNHFSIKELLTLKRDDREEPKEYIKLLECLTLLREEFIMVSGKKTTPFTQKLRLTEIGLESYAHLLLSQLVNRLYSANESETLMTVLKALPLVLRNLSLSGIELDECNAIESELNVWCKEFELNNHKQLLRLKATLDRCDRLANEFTTNLLNMFFVRVHNLGQALGLEKEFIYTYCEDEVRDSLVFQFSKLVSNTLKIIRNLANLSPWDAVVTGTVCGRITFVETIDTLLLHVAINEPVLLVVKSINGDEEIPENVVGIILGRQLPHLCHFGIRAQQANVVFTIIEDDDVFLEIKNLSGKLASLNATHDSVTCNIVTGLQETDDKSTFYEQISVREIDLSHLSKYITFDNVSMKNSGSKAYTAKLLEALSQQENADFLTPRGIVLPFSLLGECINENPSVKNEYSRLVDTLDNSLELEPIPENECKQIQSIIKKLEIDNGLLQEVIDKCFSYKRLIVRSSSNCEDNDKMSGAGIYESVANVTPLKVESAVLDVWASLWSEAAVMTRKKHGIPQNMAHMAVLIHELITPDFSFVIHTINPVNNSVEEIYIEIAVGLGEILTSGAIAGTPYRMVCNKRTGKVKILTFSNFSKSIFPDSNDSFDYKTEDYSKVIISTSEDYRNRLVQRLSSIGKFIEEIFNKPQDIEGVIVNDTVYLVQSRTQQGCA